MTSFVLDLLDHLDRRDDRSRPRLRDAHPRPTGDLRVDPVAPASAVARLVAARRELWAPHVRFDPSAAHTAPVWRDARWEVRIEAWLPGQSGGLTEHLDRPGALLVLQGALVETTWVIATDGPTPGRRHAVARRYAADDVRSHGDVHVHEVRNAGPDPAIALNVRRRG